MAPTPTTRQSTWVLWSRLLIAVLVGAAGLWGYLVEADFTHYRGDSSWPIIDALLGLIALPAVVYRRRWPLPVLLLTALIATVSVAATGPAGVVAASVCTRHRWKEMVLAGVATYASLLVYIAVHVPKGDRATTYAWGLASTAVLITAGWLIGQWREDRREAWGNAWRMVAALLVGLLLWVALAEEGASRGFQDGHLWLVLDPLIGLIAVAFLPLRRRWPMTVLALASALAMVSASSTGASLLALVSLATCRDWRRIAVGSAIALTTGALFTYIHDTRVSLPDLITNVTVVGFSVALGLFIGARRELVNNLRDQVETAQREQEARVAQARTHERARIAREMHDVLAHRISLVAMHAGALAYRDDLPPEQVRKTAGLLQETSHHALGELREVLGVLRDQEGEPGQGAPEPPQPTLTDLDELVETAVAGGQQIELYRDADTASLPNSLSRNAFRIVQEGLTNARKHAPGELVIVRLTGHADDVLIVEIRNPRPAATTEPAAPGAGLGLVGLRERATLSGGTLTAGPDRGGDFVVRATLPWTLDEEIDE